MPKKSFSQTEGISVTERLLGSRDRAERKWSGIPQHYLGVYRSPVKPFIQPFQILLAPLSIGLLALGVKYATFVPSEGDSADSAFTLAGSLAATNPAEMGALFALNFVAIAAVSYCLRTVPMRMFYDEEEEVYLVCHLHPYIPARLTQMVVPEGSAFEDEEKNMLDFDVIYANGRRMLVSRKGFVRADYYRRLF